MKLLLKDIAFKNSFIYFIDLAVLGLHCWAGFL